MNGGSGEIVSNSWSAPDVTDRSTLWHSLNEDLVEKILTKLPFPDIFQMRTLSKSWHAKLSSVSSQDNEEKKLLAAFFQLQVCEQGDKWGSFGPIFFFKEFLITCDHTWTRWYKIPTLSFLPAEAAMKVRSYFLNCSEFYPSMVGVLLLIATAFENTMFVVNILTGSCKELPALPHEDNDNERASTERRLVSIQEIYKVIVLFSEVGYVCAWIYDSSVGSWSKKRAAVQEDFEVGYFEVYLNGNIYVPLHVDEQVWGLLIFHVKDETLQLLKMPLTGVLSRLDFRLSDIVACNGTVYFVLPKEFAFVELVEADLVKRTWSNRISSPVEYLNSREDFNASGDFNAFKEKPSSDDERIFFEQEGTTGKVWTYNARTNEWSSFPKIAILERYTEHFNFQASFQPGMNPFREV